MARIGFTLRVFTDVKSGSLPTPGDIAFQLTANGTSMDLNLIGYLILLKPYLFGFDIFVQGIVVCIFSCNTNINIKPKTDGASPICFSLTSDIYQYALSSPFNTFLIVCAMI